MPRRQQPGQALPVPLTHAQRQAIAELAPGLSERLRLDEPNRRVVTFTGAELRKVRQQATTAVRRAGTGTQRNTLRHVLDAATRALGQAEESPAIPARQRVYQFKITLLESDPSLGEYATLGRR